MKTFCEIAAKIIVPAIRALLALTLIEKYNMTQVEVAKKLGTSQPAISYYMHSKRGKLALSILKSNKEIVEMVEELANNIYKGNMDDADISLIFCNICKIIRENKKLIEDINMLLSR